MTVKAILNRKSREIYTVKETDTVLRALEVLADHHIGAVLVMNGNAKMVGILSERDIVRALPHAKGKLREQPVSTIMTRNLITCKKDDSIEAVMELMTKNRIRHLPVMEKGNLVGFISIGDVVKERISDAENEAEALKQYIASG